jgi:hypothetical protein
VDVLAQTRFKLDSVREKVHLEIGLVPGVRESTLLHEVVLSIFGRAVLRPDIQQSLLKAMRGTLIGLEVSRSSDLPNASPANTDVDHSTKSDSLHQSGFPGAPSPKRTRKVSSSAQTDIFRRARKHLEAVISSYRICKCQASYPSFCIKTRCTTRSRSISIKVNDTNSHFDTFADIGN